MVGSIISALYLRVQLSSSVADNRSMTSRESLIHFIDAGIPPPDNLGSVLSCQHELGPKVLDKYGQLDLGSQIEELEQ